MDCFWKDYNFKKHVGIVALLYALVALIGNGILLKKKYNKAKKEKSRLKDSWIREVGKRETVKAVAIEYVKKPSKQAKIFNGIVGACFLADLCIYPATKKLTRKL